MLSLSRNFVWNPKVHYWVHKRLPVVCIVIQMNSVHTFSSCLLKIKFNIIINQCLYLPSDFFPLGFLTKSENTTRVFFRWIVPDQFSDFTTKNKIAINTAFYSRLFPLHNALKSVEYRVILMYRGNNKSCNTFSLA